MSIVEGLKQVNQAQYVTLLEDNVTTLEAANDYLSDQLEAYQKSNNDVRTVNGQRFGSLIEFLRNGTLIPAIKELREITGLGLKEAKWICEILKASIHSYPSDDPFPRWREPDEDYFYHVPRWREDEDDGLPF